MRKFLIIAAIVVGGLAAIAAAILLLVDVDQFREPIRAQMEKRLHRPVTIGHLGLKLIPLSIRVNDVAIAEAPQFASKAPFATAEQVYVRVGLLTLLKRQVNVESLRVVRPSIELIRDENGVWNASTIGGPSTPTGDSNSAAPSIAALDIEDGRVAITDRQQHRPRAVYDHIDLALRDYAPGHKFSAEANVHLPGGGKQTIAAHIQAETPTAGASLMAKGVDGDVTLDSVSMSGLQAFLGTTPSQAAKAVLNGKAEFQSRGSVTTGKGSVAISEPRLKDPAHLDFEMRNDAGNGLLTVSPITLKLGGLNVKGNAAVHTRETPAALNAQFQTTNASLADLLQLADAFGASAGITGSGTLSLTARLTGTTEAPVYDADGSLHDAKLTVPSMRPPFEISNVNLRVSKDRASFENVAAALGSSHVKGSLSVNNFAHPDLVFNADIDKLDVAELQQAIVPADPAKPEAKSTPLNGSGTLSARSIVYNQLALTDVRATCRLDNGVLHLDPFTAKLFGGDESGSIVLDTRQPETGYDVRAKLNKVDANRLLAATTSVHKVLFGNLSADVDVHAKPRAGQDPASALNGTVRMQLTNGKLAGVQLLNEMASLAKFLGYARRNESFTNIVKLAGTLNIQNGVATTNDLAMAFDGGSLTASGTAGLADQKLNMHVTTVLAKGLSQQAGGSKIGGFMSTALANSKGELVIPALVSGTFDKPRFEPDPARIAKMKLEGLLPTSGNAAESIQGILGAIAGARKDDTSNASQSQTPKKAKSIFDVIDSLRKKSDQK